LHFHWGSHDGVGSEHIIDGMRSSMEMHLVHYKRSYGSFDEAVDKPDGIMVLGVLYRVNTDSIFIFLNIRKLMFPKISRVRML
jgi:carbonic anhydrase